MLQSHSCPNTIANRFGNPIVMKEQRLKIVEGASHSVVNDVDIRRFGY